MTLDQKLISTIDSSIKECDSHLKWLQRGHNLLDEFFPVTADTFKSIKDDKIAILDQFIWRLLGVGE